MRAASPPQQNESENETIVISHPLFSWEKAFRELEGLMLSAPHHIAFPKKEPKPPRYSLIAKIPSVLYNR